MLIKGIAPSFGNETEVASKNIDLQFSWHTLKGLSVLNTYIKLKNYLLVTFL